MELKFESKFKSKGEFNMKLNWKFWKRRKPQPQPTGFEPPVHPFCRCILDLPRDQVARGLLLHLDERGAQVVQEEGEILESLGHRVEVHFDPYRIGCVHVRPWVVVFDVSYTWRGQSFGPEGPALVKECGLTFPNRRTPWADDVKVFEDRIAWGTRKRPTAGQIAQVIQEAERQVDDLMRAYWFNLKAELVHKPRKGKAE